MALLMAATALADPPPTDGTAARSERLSVSGNPSTVRISRFTLWDAPSEPTCFVFDIRFRNPLVMAEISTTGLGRTLLEAWRADAPAPPYPATAGASVACDGGTGWQERLRLQMLEREETIDWRVAVKLDTSPLVADGSTFEGQILVSPDGKGTVAIPLKVERSPMSPFMTAIAWLIGIVLPAGLTYWLTRQSEARNERKKREAERAELVRKQKEDFAIWRQDPGSVDLMDEFFDQQLPTARGLSHPCTMLFDWMHARSMLAKVPPADFEALAATCRTEDRENFLALLRKLFPEKSAKIPADLN
jgi:hypothetical protein